MRGRQRTCGSIATEAGAGRQRGAGPWIDRHRRPDPGAAPDRRRPGRPVPGARGDAACWLTGRTPADAERRRPHLFAYTGLATLALAARRRRRRPRRRVAPGRRLGPPQRRALGLADRPIRWLVDDARAFVGARGPARPPVRRDRARPAVLRPRRGRAAVAARGRPGRRSSAASRAILEPGGFVAADRPHDRRSMPTGSRDAGATAWAGPPRTVEAGDLGPRDAPTAARLELGCVRAGGRRGMMPTDDAPRPDPS